MPLKPTQCRRLLGLIATANGGSVVEAQVDGDDEEFWTFQGQAMFAILVAFLTCVVWNGLRQVRLFNTAVRVRTFERATQSELNIFDSLVIPTSVCCSPGGECHHTWTKCEGLQSVPMNAIKRRLSCMYCEQRDGR